MKLAYRGGILDVNDPEILKRVKYHWKLYEAPERGRIHRIEEKKWKSVSFVGTVTIREDRNVIVLNNV